LIQDPLHLRCQEIFAVKLDKVNKMNINSKDFITIKQPPTSPHIELEDPSLTILSSTIIVAP